MTTSAPSARRCPPVSSAARAERGGAEDGASVIVIGGGVTGFSTAWWLARSGIDVLVLDKGVVGWEASGRNGGGASHYHSPLFHEEQRLWPQMDELLGYATEYRRERVIFALTETTWRPTAAWPRSGAAGLSVDDLDPGQVRELVPLAGEDNVTGGIHLHYGGQANPQRTVQAYAWALQDLGGRIFQHTPAPRIVEAGGRQSLAVETPRGRIGLRPSGDRRRTADRRRCWRRSAYACPWRRPGGDDRHRAGAAHAVSAASTATASTAARPCAAIWPSAAARMNGSSGRQLAPAAADPRPLTAQPGPTGGRAAAQGGASAGDPQLGGVIENTPDGRPVLDGRGSRPT